jgi:putative pyruvate formate lyase activating enzyme
MALVLRSATRWGIPFGPRAGETLWPCMGENVLALEGEWFWLSTVKCLLCQNHDINYLRLGSPVSAGGLTDFVLSLQRRDCHSISLVTPTQVSPQTVRALVIALQMVCQFPRCTTAAGTNA